LSSIGFASTRVTVLLSVRPKGTKLTPVDIFKKAKYKTGSTWKYERGFMCASMKRLWKIKF